MKEKILRILGGREGIPISGQEICASCQCSRTAVWKAIHSLQEEGYEIDAATNRGYRLLSRPDTLTQWEIGSLLETRWAGRRLEAYYRSEVSTNTIVKKLADDGAPEGTLVVADIQEGGKGRRGREWVTPPPGANIAMSLLIRPKTETAQLAPVTLVAAMAVQAAVEEMVLAGRHAEGVFAQDGKENAKDEAVRDSYSVQIKWPNDIVLCGRKMTGILTELSLEEDRVSYAVVGIGINVNNEAFPPSIADKATSMYLETGRKWHRAELVARVCLHFEKIYELFEKDGFAVLRESYEQALAGRGRAAVVMDREPWEGTIRGVSESGELLIEDKEGKIRAVSSGEVSVRGINGYAP